MQEFVYQGKKCPQQVLCKTTCKKYHLEKPLITNRHDTNNIIASKYTNNNER